MGLAPRLRQAGAGVGQVMSASITAVCAAYFGTYDASRSRWSPPNRCDACPLRAPCLTWGRAPARIEEELDAARAVFVRDAEALLSTKEVSP